MGSDYYDAYGDYANSNIANSDWGGGTSVACSRGDGSGSRVVSMAVVKAALVLFHGVTPARLFCPHGDGGV